jgi:hypothetical protein
VTRIEFPWVKRVFPFVVGFALMDAHAAAPPLPTGVVPVAYRIAVDPDLATSWFGGTEEIDVVVKQSTDTRDAGLPSKTPQFLPSEVGNFTWRQFVTN